MKRLVARIAVLARACGASVVVGSASRADAATTDCVPYPNVVTGTVIGNVNVPGNTTCFISGAHTPGSGIVQPHAFLSMENSTVDGSVRGLNASGAVGDGPDGVCLG